MATKYGGYMGKVLKIDLTTKEVSEYPFSDEKGNCLSAERPWRQRFSEII